MTGLFVPGFAGPAHARVAIDAAQAILEATGHNKPAGPWVPVGIGVHTGIAFMGAVGSEDSVIDIVALGDAVNMAAHLASQAGRGEVLASATACEAAGLDTGQLETRRLHFDPAPHERNRSPQCLSVKFRESVFYERCALLLPLSFSRRSSIGPSIDLPG